MAKAKEPHPGTLKIGRIIGSKMIPKRLTIPDLLSNCDATKKGKREGNTISNQIFIPLDAALTAVFG